MTQQEIQERNEQIALMLGSEKKNDGQFDYWIYDHLNYDPLKIMGSSWVSGNFEFHSDWNWLMEAIQFLQKHFESKERYWTTIERYPIYSNIEDVFKVVSDFAKHYNNKEI
jgi:hypothetical protein